MATTSSLEYKKKSTSNWTSDGKARPTLALVVGASLLCSFAITDAHADKLALVPFNGPKAAAMQREVASAVPRRHKLIGASRYARTARRLKARKPTGANVKKVAARLKADGVIIGSTKRAGGKYKLTVWLRDGATGKVVGSVNLQSKRARLSKAQKRKLRTQLGGLIARLPGKGKGKRVAGKGKGKGKGRAKGRGKGKGKAKGKAKGKKRRVAGRSSTGARKSSKATTAAAGGTVAASARTDGDAGSSLLSGGTAGAPAFDLDAGLGLTSRRLDFTVAEGVVDLPQSYRSNPVASTHVSGEIYPMAFFGDARALPARFGITGGYDRVMLIESILQYNDMATGERMEVGLTTSHSVWNVGLTYRQLFGKSDRPIALRASLTFTKLAFAIDPADVPPGVEFELPNVGYSYIDPGVSIHIPITRTISAEAGGNFIAVLGSGDISQDDAYGEGSAFGYRARLFVQYDLSSALSVRAGGQLMSIGHSFDGTGASSNGRDGDPNTLDVPAASDRYINVIATAGYQF